MSLLHPLLLFFFRFGLEKIGSDFEKFLYRSCERQWSHYVYNVNYVFFYVFVIFVLWNWGFCK